MGERMVRTMSVIGTRDEQRFRRLYEANYRAILGYALRRVEDPEDAADIVAETFLVAWRRGDAVPAGDEALLWLYGVARRALANQRRSALRRGRLGERLRQELATAPPAAAGREDESSGAVRAALAELRPADRELLLLAAWEGLDSRQLAVVLGCSPNAAKVRLHRARKRFAAALKPSTDAGHVQVR